MQIETIKRPARLSKSNAHWLQVAEQFEMLKPDECLRITGLTETEIASLRRQAYREVKVRAFVRLENDELVIYLYKRRGDR